MLKPWITEFLKTVEEREPYFIALHCQEVGGKNYEESMQHVEHFVRSLMNRGTMMPYDKIRVFLDEEYESAEKFTALGNLYFIHQNVHDISIWDFEEKKFVECVDRREYSGNIEDVSTKEKSKFPQEFFPECKWSRKGFMRTRWCLNGTKFDLVNIHLFHDASNFIAMEEFPSVYTLNRKRALEHTLDRFHNDKYETVPFFIFGDFNFRLNTQAVVKKLTQGCTPVDTELPDTGEKAQEYRDNRGQVQLTVSKKAFKHRDHSNIFLKDNGSLVREYDQELAHFGDRLAEYPISFPPSYPFEEGPGGDGGSYMQTRCPSWCDRIVLDKAAKKLVDSSGGKVKYDIIGLTTTMGDHKPVSLCVDVACGAGTVSCCSSRHPCPNFVHDPQAPCFLQGPSWCLCHSYPPCPRPVVCSSNPPATTTTTLPDPSVPPDPHVPTLPPDTPLTAPNGSQLDHSAIFRVDAKVEKDSVDALSERQRLLGPQCVCSAGVSEERLGPGCQCTCTSREPRGRVPGGVQSGDLLRNLLLLGGSTAGSMEVSEHLLKRVNSAPNSNVGPFKVQSYHYDPRHPPLPHHHIPLASSQSLDTGRSYQQKYPPSAKLRLRASSSRFLSHHSSSTEEWFEEVPVPENKGDDNHTAKTDEYTCSPGEKERLCGDTTQSAETVEMCSGSLDKPPPPSPGSHDLDSSWCAPPRAVEESGDSLGSAGDSRDGDSRGENLSTKGDVCLPHKCSTEQQSLNNLLLVDSCDQLSAKPLTQSESSLSAHYSEGSISSSGRPLRDGETVSQAPTFDIADVDSASPTKSRCCSPACSLTLNEGTPIDEPVWQLRGGETKGGEGSSGGSSPGQKKTIGDERDNEGQEERRGEEEEEEEEEGDSGGVGRLKFEPPGMVSSRYLAAAAAPDTHVHIFRETTV
ncbi:hypothetical protein Pcinc_009558 [Petrolisthes cinctipes]|uniref:inositol-polyphosphate 5-phosphatase n=1 Tax=Petrolisthes cinctipes TaxID=88211 RepID=A0AAE1G6K9_PETCI|nr:hypothetical protein Pcinc_009558 [Petrolisthes cinctipes]